MSGSNFEFGKVLLTVHLEMEINIVGWKKKFRWRRKMVQ